MAVLPVKRGLSSPAVVSIPQEWDRQWFRYFIDNFLTNADIRNVSPGAGIAISGNVSGNSTSGTPSTVVTIGFGPIANNTVLGNVSGGPAVPVGITQAQLTALVNVFTSTLSGAVPASSGGITTFLRADTSFAVPPTFTGIAPGYVPASGGGTVNFLRADGTFAVPVTAVGANPSASVGLSAVNGVATTFLRSDGAPALSQAIAPTWTGIHIHSPASGVPITVNQNASGGVSVQGAGGISALVELAGNGQSIGSTSVAVGQDASGDATVFQRATRQLYFATNAIQRVNIASGGAVTINAATSGNSLTVNGNTASIAAIVASGLTGVTGGADLKVTRAGSTQNQAGQGPNVFLTDITNTHGYYLQDGGGQFELWSSVGGGPTLTQIFKVLTTGGLTYNAPASAAAMDVSGASGANTIYIHGNSAANNSFGLRIDAGTSTSDFPLLIDNQAATLTLFKVGGSGVIQVPQVGTTASAANAFLDNTTSNTLLRSTSSIRYKTDVEPLFTRIQDSVLKMRPVWYRSLAEADRKDWSWIGLIAEEVASVEPRLVHWTKAEDGTLIPDAVQYERVAVALLGLVQRMHSAITKAGIIVE